MNILKIYENYGVLGAEKSFVFTGCAPHPNGRCSEVIFVALPNGWSIVESDADSVLLESPWGWIYTPDEVLCGRKHPCFIAFDSNGSRKLYKLRVVTRENLFY